ncbi:MAG: NADH-quinone oxidoreductase subunit J [Gammaproteobacteria bacterium]|nr:NADH-quinone oxidoreductase subunit J [Gammaproteobacteria bacterium]MDH5653051.1 NADH-quinone oxidoreductase subunit J [Gammaproteobacteria bacterium]
MGVEKVLFYIFAAMMVISATMVITVRNPIRAALFLVLTFFSSAVLWMLLEAEFLAIVLVLVYVGAVMVLFLFVVMMLDINMDRLKEGFIRYLPFGVLIALLMVGMIIYVVGPGNFGLDKIAEPARHAADYNNTKALGMVLYTDYVYPFEIAAVLLLVAIVAAIALTMRRREGTKYQKPEQQISVNRNERVRLVKMSAEQKK